MNARLVLLTAVVGVAGGLDLVARADAPAGRYTVANGTVYDTKTKLTWQQQVPEKCTWAVAQAYCSQLSLAGTGWRLPTVKELATVVDESLTNPAIDPTAFPATWLFPFWSSSPYADGTSSYVWYVDFTDGNQWNAAVDESWYVRCVR